MAEGAITCRGLARDFDGRAAVVGLDLDVPRGSVYALVGPNGAGKTTTVRMLAGLLAPSAGQARVAGCAIQASARSEHEALHARIGILTEAPGLYERLTARENLAFFGRLHGMDPARLERRLDELLATFELRDRGDERVARFSKGMKQKVAIARALLHDPEVLFLDEPTSGLDPEAAYEVRELIASLRAQGRTILLTTHRLEEAEQLADRIGVFKARLVAEGTLAELRGRAGAHELAVRVADAAGLVDVARAVAGVSDVVVDGATLIVTVEDLERDTPRVVTALVGAGAAIRAVEPRGVSLEAIYLELVGHP